ncbi:hypothetical protein ESY86_01285 [Subsaximicrobium wynnwilliamsii]|jgi:hypothetical protein|uniref:Phage holin family protein n=1 Tax=Subsaximicrobium wynnwilliamsii TaxID=291179 RepID=A0A5C6ZN26_9FLAO|nr:phage holin family protein [Subsaximicrobium wynnwilliamsii]TXD85206.1 hypothetical protein ESY87_02455 [Subsaximicrobium wynnwilliamsii]TXD91249.1 hypothetical protein ESY86_01285 [Subsaximicrobium wynnwilliamsii]TXE04642.1 hypothetical protein ESY88_03935 [Subsaximicrobium wynnwilliamsii]
MSVFNSISETTDKATDIGEKYYNASLQYFKLKLFKRVASVLSIVAKLAIVGILALLTILFLAVSAAIAIGQELDNLALGYLIVGGILLLLAIIVVSLGSVIDGKILKNLSDKFWDDDDD